ncbi:N-acetylmuramoyl-L-alanine amidase [Ruixingdingia sedimenti]|uniref:N-acetylmuramoyl-L-alanine amidase n=1 Tax=Ruixingdingia sedimenti TaxID=3073604 RepID=A0ABU1FEA9_9RHOB|nr:N-acetylmuramoyl-L-alanine amidase [Xinfangfangia sp. LG-4]MDR5655233.1 N-acetylmuramoyl-L-alanine amidase [Xinfangfangia sp. LG-4]
MSKAAISLIQTGLRDLGYQPGPVDGIYGPRTRDAALTWLEEGGQPLTSIRMPLTSAMIYQGAARYPVQEIILHCSATRPSWMADRSLADQVAEIRRWHVQDNGWRGIGYHWIIGRDGSILPGRKETEIGAGVVGRNQGVIHAVLIGGHGSSERDRFSEHFTAAQDLAARQLLQGIGMRTRITRISGHNEHAAKACPGFTVSDWLKEAA